ncbi:MAG: hypothetical protein AB8B55_12615 [Mariniblastus sp.]
MISGIKSSVGAYESGSINLSDDVRVVQTILTKLASSLGNSKINPKGVDGKIARTASQSNTVSAIANFQRQYAGMVNPDRRIDVGGNTWNTMISLANGGSPGGGNGGSPGSGPGNKKPVSGEITMLVRHFDRIPQHSAGVTPNYNGQFESQFRLSGAINGRFTGSIYPDNMNTHGRIKDGTYPLHIGFHHGGGAPRQGADKLKVGYSGVRPGLLVNMRERVPIISANSGLHTSGGINVHNGNSSNNRGSNGCLTMSSQDWVKFISLFLNGFPNIEDWHARYTNTGKRIGQLVVRA